MSFFSGLRGLKGTPQELPEQWSVPEKESDIDVLLKNSANIQIIYKHSFSCGVSVMARPEVEAFMDEYKETADFHFVDVKQNRSISNYVADKTGVRHESPQIIIVRNGEVFWSETHGMIREEDIREALNEM